LAATSSDKKIPSLDLMPFIGCFGRVQDERLKTAVAIQAVPNVTEAFIVPVLGPFGGNQRDIVSLYEPPASAGAARA
jgi:hypothetical protein